MLENSSQKKWPVANEIKFDWLTAQEKFSAISQPHLLVIISMKYSRHKPENRQFYFEFNFKSDKFNVFNLLTIN